jgi:hypothetical protein
MEKGIRINDRITRLREEIVGEGEGKKEKEQRKRPNESRKK